MTNPASSTIYTSQKGFAALFLDFENVFYYFKRQYHDPPEPNDYVLEILRALRLRLEEQDGLQTIIMKAYADFERLGTASQGSLYLMGIDTHNVLGTDHKNAADMRLCIDALEVLYTRPEIHTFIFVAGDRDYIPVIQHLRRQARNVLTVAFKETVSGDLLQNVGKNHFIEAGGLLSEETIARLEKRKSDRERALREAELLKSQGFPALQKARGIIPETKPVVVEEVAVAAETNARPEEKTYATGNGNGAQQTLRAFQPAPKPRLVKPPFQADSDEFEEALEITGENERKCLGFILEMIGKRHELWVGPMLRQLNSVFPLLADYERKQLIETLTQAGAIRIEKRAGDPYDFTVLLVNYNHPDVRELYCG